MLLGRTKDAPFFYGTYGGMSDDFGNARGEDLDYEVVLEHRFQFTPVIFLQPSVQDILTPTITPI